ncbi:MAG: hypothetical protein WC797_03715 [Candidatus Paceibacterota bacterium]
MKLVESDNNAESDRLVEFVREKMAEEISVRFRKSKGCARFSAAEVSQWADKAKASNVLAMANAIATFCREETNGFIVDIFEKTSDSAANMVVIR